jgi:hypothetical protein
MSDPRVVYILRHDFNKPKNEGGFYEVVLPDFWVNLPLPGDEVEVRDDDPTGPTIRGRIRCLVAVVEEKP